MGAAFRPPRRDSPEPWPPSDGEPAADSASLSVGLADRLAARREALSSSIQRRRRRRWVSGVVVVAIAALSVLATFAYLDLGGGSHTGPLATPTSYYGTLGTASSTARASFWSWPPNGPSLVFAEGLDSPASLGLAVNTTHLGAISCLPTVISTSVVGSLPAFGGNLTSGLASEWLYAFLATGNTLVVVAVADGASAVVATTPSNGACYNGPTAFPVIPVDSTVAAEIAGATSMSSKFFASADANSTPLSTELFLAPPGFVPGTPMMEPIWVVTDTTCALFGSSATSGSTLTSDVNAGIGSLLAQKATSVTC